MSRAEPLKFSLIARVHVIRVVAQQILNDWYFKGRGLSSIPSQRQHSASSRNWAASGRNIRTRN